MMFSAFTIEERTADYTYRKGMDIDYGHYFEAERGIGSTEVAGGGCCEPH